MGYHESSFACQRIHKGLFKLLNNIEKGNTMKLIRMILNNKSKLTTSDRRLLENEVCHLNKNLQGNDENFLEMCKFCMAASKKALKIRFLY